MLSWTPIDADYFVDFRDMTQVNRWDKSKVRPVMRGEAGQRMCRPSDEKFTDNSMFDIGKFEAYIAKEKGKKWLG